MFLSLKEEEEEFKKFEKQPKSSFFENPFNPKTISPNAWINPQNKLKFEKNSKEILCTAGSNYLIAKHDGKMYRCFHDLKPLGDILDYPNNISRQCATPCSVGYICDSSGDQMFTTQWGTNKFFKNKTYKNNPVCTKWKESKSPKSIVSEYAYVIVTPTYSCNYRCPYCCNFYPDNDSNRPIDKIRERPKEDWFKFFDLLNENLKSVQMVYIGGEPLMYPKIAELIEYTYNLGFESSIVSNFSSEKRLKEISEIKMKDKSLFDFSCTIHPTNKDRKFSIELILEYFLLFKRRGHRVRASIVSWPDNVPFYKKWKPVFETMGIPLWLKGCGGYDEHPGFTKEIMSYLFHEGSHKTTSEHLEEIGWCYEKKTDNHSFIPKI